MADAEVVAMDTDSTTVKVEQLKEAFAELESHRSTYLHDETKWEDIKEHFDSLEKSLKEKFDELEKKEKAFKEKQSETQILLAEREATVAAKERGMLDRLQELKDAAVSAIAEARKNCKVDFPVPVDIGGTKENKAALETSADTGATDGQDASSQELSALRAVVRCIEDKKLQDEYPLGSLQKRVSELKQSRISKGLSVATKVNSKRPRFNTPHVPRKPIGVVGARQYSRPIIEDRGAYGGVAERYPYPVTYDPPTHASYGQQPSHGLYGQQPSHGLYGQQETHGLYGQQGAYNYPAERAHPPSSYNTPASERLHPASSYNAPASSYNAPSYGSYPGSGLQSAAPTHGDYMGSGYQPPQSSYQSGLSNYGGFAGADLQPPHQPYK